MYQTIYSPEGEMFEVPRERAAQLLLNHGWLKVKPEPKPVAFSEPVVEEITNLFGRRKPRVDKPKVDDSKE